MVIQLKNGSQSGVYLFNAVKKVLQKQFDWERILILGKGKVKGRVIYMWERTDERVFSDTYAADIL